MNTDQYGMPQADTVTGRSPHWHMPVAGAALIILAVVAWVFLRPSGTADGVTLSVQPPAAPVRAGSEFTVDVVLDAKSYAVTAAQLAITYDARILRAVSIQAGELMPTELARGSVGNGTATVTVASGTRPAVGGGVIARMTFQALAAGESKVSFTAETQTAATGYSGDVTGDLVSATVLVQ